MVRERANVGWRRARRSLTDPDVDVVEGDERRIQQVIFNLLSNAVKFTPPGGEVDVSAARVNGEVRVSVSDTGPGIAAEDQERIFEEFQQTEAGHRQREGTGLGLALSKRFVELHGGTHLGRERDRQWEHVRRSRSPRGRADHGGRADPRRRGQRAEHEAVPRRARRHGLPGARGDDRRQAIALATEQAPDLVLMDIRLPDLDGVEALRRLRADERTATIPVLAVTAQAMSGDRRAVPGRRLRRLRREAREHRRAHRYRSRALRPTLSRGTMAGGARGAEGSSGHHRPSGRCLTGDRLGRSVGGRRRIRTSVGYAGDFTGRSLWPLGHPPGSARRG